jgi:hypothetical protein
MILARTIQALGLAALAGAAGLALEARPERETLDQRGDRMRCETRAAIAGVDRLLGHPSPTITCAPNPRATWHVGTLTLALQGLAAGLLLLGVGTIAADVRRMRDRPHD